MNDIHAVDAILFELPEVTHPFFELKRLCQRSFLKVFFAEASNAWVNVALHDERPLFFPVAFSFVV
ncbi:MAG: hypothetical protein EOM12_07865 [Verrucomicrobiae bacterium]|nr:hypothetical protein [Verrucomicrobiae bacterium]